MCFLCDRFRTIIFCLLKYFHFKMDECVYFCFSLALCLRLTLYLALMIGSTTQFRWIAVNKIFVRIFTRATFWEAREKKTCQQNLFTNYFTAAATVSLTRRLIVAVRLLAIVPLCFVSSYRNEHHIISKFQYQLTHNQQNSSDISSIFNDTIFCGLCPPRRVRFFFN